MKKIPFDIKYRPQIESGEVNVLTRDERPIEILKWDAKGDYPIIGVFETEADQFPYLWSKDGDFYGSQSLISTKDLFLLIPEEDQGSKPFFNIEIPFGAFDSDLVASEWRIPEGYTARIEDGKVIVEKDKEALTPFEERLKGIILEYQGKTFSTQGIRKEAATLLDIARQQIQEETNQNTNITLN